MNLVEFWIYFIRKSQGMSLAQGIRDMNDATGRQDRNGRIYEWRDGIHPLPPEVARHMMGLVIEPVLIEFGFDNAVVTNMDTAPLVDVLSAPVRC